MKWMQVNRIKQVLLLLLGVFLVGALTKPDLAYGQGAAAARKKKPVKAERLVPAAMGIRTDKLGNSWNVEQNGNLSRVGNNMMVNSGLSLYINNQQFYTYQPMMTADGAEYVLHSRQSSAMMGLQVVRRIRLLEKQGVMRYLEILTNTTSNPLTVNLSLRTNFSGNYKTHITNDGRSNAVLLGARESGLLVMPGSNQVNRAFVFSLCSEKSTLKPSISSQNKYALNFQYSVTLAAGQTVVLAHAVSQVPLPHSFERKTMRRLFRPVALARLQSFIPNELRKLVINYSGAASLEGLALMGMTDVASLGVDRSSRDTLAMGEKTRLLGKASCSLLKIQTVYGAAQIPFAKVAAIVGGNRGRREGARVFLRDGQVFSGALQVKALRFAMAGGGSMNLDVEKLDRLVMAKSANEGKWEKTTVAMMETYAGDRLALSDGAGLDFSGMTPWGALHFALKDILWMAPQEDELVGHFVEFKNGARNFVYLLGDELKVDAGFFGKQAVKLHELRAVVTRASVERKPAEDASGGDAEVVILQPYLKAGGNQLIIGKATDEQLKVMTSTEVVQLRPEEIRVMKNISDELDLDREADCVFRFELWGGGVVTGYLSESFLSMKVRGEDWRVPLRDVQELVTPVPQLGETVRKDLARLIRQMGSVEWQVRERATEDLLEFGYMAKSILQQEYQSNGDPEIRRRVGQVLARLGP
ncbi:MAG: hypothetical protein L3J39_16770 [Verrucomicrobiales bacterium]|nr:hypothetical protein [Verrucomicrobiales bacterium]